MRVRMHKEAEAASRETGLELPEGGFRLRVPLALL